MFKMGLHDPFEYLKHKKGRESNCQFDSRPLKVANHPDFLACRWRVTYRWKALNEATTLLQTSPQSEVCTQSIKKWTTLNKWVTKLTQCNVLGTWNLIIKAHPPPWSKLFIQNSSILSDALQDCNNIICNSTHFDNFQG